MQKILFLIVVLLLISYGCQNNIELQSCMSTIRDTLLYETFDEFDTTFWKIKYKDGIVPEESARIGVVNKAVYSKEVDNCLRLYNENSMYSSSNNSYVYFDLTNLNPNKTLEVEFTCSVKSYSLDFNVINISNYNAILWKGFGEESIISLDRIENGSYTASDTIRFTFANSPRYETGYECYIDDIKIIEINNE